jgi:hypothetical protein
VPVPVFVPVPVPVLAANPAPAPFPFPDADLPAVNAVAPQPNLPIACQPFNKNWPVHNLGNLNIACSNCTGFQKSSLGLLGYIPSLGHAALVAKCRFTGCMIHPLNF